MSETPETCTKRIYEPCLLHPVDCPNCQSGDVCQMREDMQRYPEIIKSCRFFRKKKERRA